MEQHKKYLNLPLKKQWFEMTKAGIKLEDYREINGYWCSRILRYKGEKFTVSQWDNATVFHDTLAENYSFHDFIISSINRGIISLEPYKFNKMCLGYPKKSDLDRILKLEHKGIEIRTGNPEWGAEPNKIYFVIKHGAIL